MRPFGERAALVLVDIQEGLDEPKYGRRNNPLAEHSAARLLAAWRESGRPVVHVRHMSVERDSPLRPGLPGNELKAIVRPAPGEPVVEKSANSAFVGTDLEERLRSSGIETVVVAGLTTDHCVSSTVRTAGDLGFEAYVVSDATATHERAGAEGERFTAEEMHEVSLASLRGEFATVANTEEILKLL
ncbi:MAG: cysteine hydrolase family protein [Rubrobacter sp.]